MSLALKKQASIKVTVSVILICVPGATLGLQGSSVGSEQKPSLEC